MRRLFLLLLALILPMQMSWAATHFCDDEKLVAAQVHAAFGGHGHEEGSADKPAGDAQAEKIADACCGAAHGCHVLHHLMSQEDLAFALIESSQTPAHRAAAPPLSVARSRIERPNWLAA